MQSLYKNALLNITVLHIDTSVITPEAPLCLCLPDSPCATLSPPPFMCPLPVHLSDTPLQALLLPLLTHSLFHVSSCAGPSALLGSARTVVLGSRRIQTCW